MKTRPELSHQPRPEVGEHDRRALALIFALVAFGLLALLGCGPSGGGGGDPHGLEERVPVEGLTFPTGLPSPAALRAVHRFPALRFARPIFITAAPDGTDRLFVVEKGGRILVFPDADDAVASAALFLDITDRVDARDEAGLLGLAFHPAYAASGAFYVYYTAGGPLRSRVARFHVTADPSAADPASEEILLEFEQPFDNHNAGMIAFGPDGKLYVASGDGGSGHDPMNHAQRLDTLLGKILRLEDDGSIPADNPFNGVAGARGEIWAYGLRNPWRFSFDRVTGTLWAGDVGQNEREEVDIIVKGGNYGWRIYEGERSHINPGGLPREAFERPVHEYDHTVGMCVTGGYVYRGSDLPSLTGAYVFADFASGNVYALVHDGTRTVSVIEAARVQQPTSFGEDRRGELYITSFGGEIYQLEEVEPQPDVFPTRLSETGLFTDVAALVPAPGVLDFDVNAPLWSDGALKRRWLALPGLSEVGFQEAEAWTFPLGAVLVKHFELEVEPGLLRRLETRVLLRHAAGWQGYTYRWNAGETDADLIDDAEEETLVVMDPGAPGGTRDVLWRYPSRAQCLACHTEAAGTILGVRTRQLHRDHDFDGVTDNILRAWSHIGIFDRRLPPLGRLEALASPWDATQPRGARARAYLDANCAPCHRPGGLTAASLDLRLEADRAALGVDAPPSRGDLGLAEARVIAPGRKESSVLWERIRRLDGARMPPLGSTVVDAEAAMLIGEWIDDGAP